MKHTILASFVALLMIGAVPTNTHAGFGIKIGGGKIKIEVPPSPIDVCEINSGACETKN